MKLAPIIKKDNHKRKNNNKKINNQKKKLLNVKSVTVTLYLRVTLF